MPSDTALAMAQAAAAEMGILVPTQLLGAQDNTSRQLGSLLNRIGFMLFRAHDWTQLVAQYHITLPAPIQDQGSFVAGSPVINGLGQAALLPPIVNQAVVYATPVMQSVRLIGVSGNAATIDQPATQTGSFPVQFAQDSFPIPVDWGRAIDRTAWDRSNRWELRGPNSAQFDQWLRSGIVATGPRRHYRQVDGCWRIWPPPGNSPNDPGSQLNSEYLSKYWAIGALTGPQDRFLTDGDTCIFDTDVMVTGMKYLFFQAKGFSYDEYKTQFMRMMQNAIATDGPSATLDMARTRWPTLVSPANVPDTNYGGVTSFGGAFGNR